MKRGTTHIKLLSEQRDLFDQRLVCLQIEIKLTENGFHIDIFGFLAREHAAAGFLLFQKHCFVIRAKHLCRCLNMFFICFRSRIKRCDLRDRLVKLLRRAAYQIGIQPSRGDGRCALRLETAQKLCRVIRRHFVHERGFLQGSGCGIAFFGIALHLCLSRLVLGSRISLTVGFIAVFLSLLIGITIGSLGGFFRGKVDDVVVWFINVVWSIPTLLLVIAITFALGKGIAQVFIAVGLTMWVEVARIVRGQILSIRETTFVEAGKALGFKNIRIIFKHILPNIINPIIVVSAANFASAILLEAGLSFLGIGVQPPMPSWGSMIKENYAFIILDAAYLAILPGIAIMLLVLAFMLVGNALRDALDVKN